MLKVPPMEAQLAVGKLRWATQTETSQQALALVVSSAGAEWREELIRAMELVAEIMNLDLTSRSTRGKSSGTSGLVGGLHC